MSEPSPYREAGVDANVTRRPRPQRRHAPVGGVKETPRERHLYRWQPSGQNSKRQPLPRTVACAYCRQPKFAVEGTPCPKAPRGERT